jgi:hypothetical protein
MIKRIVRNPYVLFFYVILLRFHLLIYCSVWFLQTSFFKCPLNFVADIINNILYKNTVKPVYTEPNWDQLLCAKNTVVRYIQVELTKISYLGMLFTVRFIRVYSGFSVDRFHCILFLMLLYEITQKT